MENNLENIPKKNPFSVPDGYFDESKSRIENAVFIEQLKLRAIGTGFTVPDNYFEELPQQITAEISLGKLKSSTATSGFSTPVDYFEKLQANITAATTEKKEPRMLKLWHSSLMKYASAACFLLLSATGMYFYQNQSPAQQTAYNDLATEQMLYDIDEDVIIDHIKESNLQAAKPAVTDVALENYILSNYSQNEIASDL
jgi:hypothetical protein